MPEQPSRSADDVRELELSLAQCRSRIVDEMKLADDLGEACEWFHSLRHVGRSEFDDEVKATTAVEKMDAAVDAWRAARPAWYAARCWRPERHTEEWAGRTRYACGCPLDNDGLGDGGGT